jgi:hypothetical protein
VARRFQNNGSDVLAAAHQAGSVDVTGAHFTLCAWVKPASVSSDDVIAGKWGGAFAYVLGHDASAHPYLFLNGSVFYTSTFVMLTNRWQHLAAVKDGSTAKIFWNGREIYTGTDATSIGSIGQPFTIGSQNGGSSPYNGDIEQVGLWNAGLSGYEVDQLARGMSPGKIRPLSLRGYWPLTDYRPGTGDAEDLSKWRNKAVRSGTVNPVPGPDQLQIAEDWVPTTETLLIAGGFIPANLNAPFIAAATQMFAPIVVPGRPVAPPFIASATALYTPSLARSLVPSAIAATTVLYTPTVRRSSIALLETISDTHLFTPRVVHPLVNVVPPTISGTAMEGQQLEASPGVWSGDAPMSYSYQWRRCNAAGGACVDITGETGSTYIVRAADIGGTLRVQVTASN